MNSLPTIFVARPIPQCGLELLRQVAAVRQHLGSLPPTRHELLEGVQGCHAILSLLSDRIDAEAMEAAGPQLRVISNFAVGYNNIDVPQARRRGIAVGNTPDVLTEATADIAVGLMIAAARQFKSAMSAVALGGWKAWEPLGWIGVDLNDRVLGIVGMGRIGQAVARRMHAGWGMKVLYTSRRNLPEIDRQLAARRVALDELMAASDFISLHLPLSDKTRGSIGSDQFARMKSTAVLVNTARGEIVDQAALIDALQNRRIFAAGLDVCTPEPLPLDNPLHSLDNCMLLPHIGSATQQARDAMSSRAAMNIIAGLSGQPLPYPVH